MKAKIFFALSCLSLLFGINIANASLGQWQENQSKGAKARVIGSFYTNDKGEKKLIAGLHFKIASGWKIYGKSSDGIGMPPSLDFTGSKNYKKNEIIWPQAHIGEETIGKEVIKYHYYKDEVVLPIEIDLNNIDQSSELAIKLEYGLCKDICIPASEKFTITISDKKDDEAIEIIQKFYPSKLDAKAEFVEENNIEKEAVVAPKITNTSTTLIKAIIFGIIGGAILNIMPCVLPVLSIKLMSIIQHSNASISRIRFSFFATIIGILTSFLILALLAILISLTGNSLGWGLQFQNPYFLIFLILVVMLFIANLLGIFEITFNGVITTILDKKITQEEEKKNIFIPNFLSGILAVLLATPCSAPFLGSAISFALVQDYSIIFLMFLAIGFGFALPYFILIITPKLVYLMPKPGSWMVKIKQLMSILLSATVIWLLYILSHNIGTMPAIIIGVLSILLTQCLKIKSILFKPLAIITIVSLSFSLPVDFKNNPNIQRKADEIYWKKFDEMQLYSHVNQGDTVIVDVTADWCLTCKLNEARIFKNREVMAKLEKGANIILMRADITKPDEEVMLFLKKHGRFAIPFNAVFGPNAKNGLLTSELLTEKELLELVNKASKK